MFRARGLALRPAYRRVGMTLVGYLSARLKTSRRQILSAPIWAKQNREAIPSDTPDLPLCVKAPRGELLKPSLHSPYLMDWPDFERRYGFTDQRMELLAGLERFRGTMRGSRIAGFQWIAGSFVSNKPNPSDIDVITFITSGPRPAPWLNSLYCLSPLDYSREEIFELFKCDAFFVDCRADPGALPRAVAFWIQHLGIREQAQAGLIELAL